jgi:hypothetical protein
MNERKHGHRNIEETLLLAKAAEELGQNADYLKLTKDGIILIDYPMILSNLPPEIVIKKREKIKNLVLNVKNDIHLIVSDSTPFRDRTGKDFKFMRNHMQSAFFNMVELTNHIPQLEIDMPEGIVDIAPGLLIPYTKTLGNNQTFIGRKYIPPRIENLGDEFDIKFLIKPPQSKKIYPHVIPYQFKR